MSEDNNSPQRQASRYFIVYGETSGPLTKAECANAIAQDNNSGRIKKVVFGREVKVQTKKTLDVTLD